MAAAAAQGVNKGGSLVRRVGSLRSPVRQQSHICIAYSYFT